MKAAEADVKAAEADAADTTIRKKTDAVEADADIATNLLHTLKHRITVFLSLKRYRDFLCMPPSKYHVSSAYNPFFFVSLF